MGAFPGHPTENGPICSDHRSPNHSSPWPSHHEPVFAYETTLFLSPLPILEDSHMGARTRLLSVNASAAQRTNTWDAWSTRLVSGHVERRNKGEKNTSHIQRRHPQPSVWQTPEKPNQGYRRLMGQPCVGCLWGHSLSSRVPHSRIFCQHALVWP